MRAAADPSNLPDEGGDAPSSAHDAAPMPVVEAPAEGNGRPESVEELPLAEGMPPPRPPLILVEPEPPALPDAGPAVGDARKPIVVVPDVKGWTRYSLWILLAITLLGGVLRFAWIDRPALWTDESYTFGRLSGSYQDLLDVLQYDGFGPLHYQLYWWIAHKSGHAWSDPKLMTSHDYAKQVIGMTPFWMRFVPSLLGTLMVPVMYFLARQMTSRRTSLLVAAFTACSAFMMVYSHDAKMYMMLWFFGALSTACLLWWFRTDMRLAWLAWIAATLAMAGTQASGLVLLAVQPVFMITQRRMHWKKFILFVVGLAVVASGPLVHYTRFSKFVDRVEDDWSASGVTWATAVVRGRSGPEMALQMAGAFAFSWEWPRRSYDPDDPENRTERMDSSSFSTMLQGFNIPPAAYVGLMTAIMAVLVACAVGALPWSRRLRGETLDDRPTQPWWRTTLWLAAWIVVPAYGFYCASLKGMGQEYAKPREWVDSFGLLINDRWALVSVIVVGLFTLCLFVRRFAAFLAGGVAVMLAAVLVGSLLPAVFNRPVGTEHGGVYYKYWEFIEWWRILRIVGNRWYDALSTQTMVTAGILLLPPLVWYYSAGTTWERLLRAFQFLLIVAAIYALCVGVYEYLIKNPPSNESALWMPRWLGMIWPAFAIAVCALVMRLPTWPLRGVAIVLLLGVNTSQALARMFWGAEPRLDMMYAEIKESQPRRDGTEPTFRAYIAQASNMTNHPAGANLTSNQAKYYAALARGESWAPQSYRNASVIGFAVHPITSPPGIAADVRRSPQLNHVVVWDRLPEREEPAERLKKLRKALNSAKAGLSYTVDGRTYGPSDAARLEPLVAELEKQAKAPDPDPILAALGPGWTMGPTQWHPVRYHWNWSEMYVNRRREYKKVGAAQ
jgi:hypothetical protein